jgi:hypothetical protein
MSTSLVAGRVAREDYAFLKNLLFEMLLVHPDRAPSQLHRGPRSDEPLLFQDKMARLMRLAMVRRTRSSSVKQATTLDLDEPIAQHETFSLQFSETRNAPLFCSQLIFHVKMAGLPRFGRLETPSLASYHQAVAL